MPPPQKGAFLRRWDAGNRPARMKQLGEFVAQCAGMPGPQLEEACTKLGGCPPGEAKATRGFRLPVKHVVHTVPPLWTDDGEPEAVLAVSGDPFVVYTSNIAAVVGLRSLYQLLAVAVSDLVHLETAVAVVLGFVGLKSARAHTLAHATTRAHGTSDRATERLSAPADRARALARSGARILPHPRVLLRVARRDLRAAGRGHLRLHPPQSAGRRQGALRSREHALQNGRRRMSCPSRRARPTGTAAGWAEASRREEQRVQDGEDGGGERFDVGCTPVHRAAGAAEVGVLSVSSRLLRVARGARVVDAATCVGDGGQMW